MKFTGKWIEPEKIILGEVTQAQNTKMCMSAFKPKIVIPQFI